MLRSATRIALVTVLLFTAVAAVGLFVWNGGSESGALTTRSEAVTQTASAAAAASGDAPASSSTPATSDVAAATTSTEEWPAVAEATITTDDLNVRVGPGTRFAVLGRLQAGDTVPVAGIVLGPWLGLPGIGWIAYSEEWLELSMPIEQLPDISDPLGTTAFVGPLYPSWVGSGFPVLDQVLQAAIAGDSRGLLSFVAGATPTDGAETTSSTTSGPTAATSTPTATSTPEAAAVCASTLPIPANELPDHIDVFLSSGGDDAEVNNLHLYAVVRGPFAGDGVAPPWVAVLSFEDGDARQLWVSSDGEITQFRIGCPGAPPGILLHTVPGEPFFWIRPPAPEPLEPVSDG